MAEIETKDKTVVTESSKKTDDSSSSKGRIQVHVTFRSFILSKKLWMTILATLIIWLAYWKEVNYLYSFTSPDQITAFSGITRDFMFAMTAIIGAYLGIQGLVNWKHGTETVLNQASSFINERKEEHTTHDENQNITITKYIKEEGVNAPEAKPFGQTAQGSDEEEGEHRDF